MEELAADPRSPSACRSCARRCCAAPRCSCATWPRSAATCCSAPAAATSATRRCAACNKRTPGSGCAAVDGVGADARHPRRERALHRAARLGSRACRWSPSTPSCTSRGRAGSGRIPLTEFYRRAGRRPGHRERARPRRADHRRSRSRCCPTGARSGYLKVRDRASYEFALASAAVALLIEDGVIAEARARARRGRHDPVAGARGRGRCCAARRAAPETFREPRRRPRWATRSPCPAPRSRSSSPSARSSATLDDVAGVQS